MDGPLAICTMAPMTGLDNNRGHDAPLPPGLYAHANPDTDEKHVNHRKNKNETAAMIDPVCVSQALL